MVLLAGCTNPSEVETPGHFRTGPPSRRSRDPAREFVHQKILRKDFRDHQSALGKLQMRGAERGVYVR
jgi:hypothetical protein